MSYDLMLMADPGPSRERVFQILDAAPDIRRDGSLENRLWLTTDHGEATVNIGTKDPVESIHLEFDQDDLDLMDDVTERGLELAAALDMYVEDVQWGHEVTRERLPELREFWRTQFKAPPPAEPFTKKPWWKVW